MAVILSRGRWDKQIASLSLYLMQQDDEIIPHQNKDLPIVYIVNSMVADNLILSARALDTMLLTLLWNVLAAPPGTPFTNMDCLKSQHGWLFTSIIKCGMKLLIHSQISMQPLKFGNGWVISFHTLLSMWLLIHAGIKVDACLWKGPLEINMVHKTGCFKL